MVVLTWTHKQLVLKSWMILSLEVVDLLFVQSPSFLGLSVTITATTTCVNMILYIRGASVYPQVRISTKHLLKVPVFMLILGVEVLGFLIMDIQVSLTTTGDTSIMPREVSS